MFTDLDTTFIDTNDSKRRIAKEVVEKKVLQGKPFSYESLKDEIINAGGILRPGGYATLGLYLEKLEDRGILEYNANLDEFEVKGDLIDMVLKENFP